MLFGGAVLAAVVLGLLESLWPRFQVDALPVACAFRRTTGYPCPGCGLTRSWVALGRGDLASSLAYHRLGWLVMLWTALQVLRHGSWLVLTSLRPTIDRLGWWLDRSLFAIALAMFTSWGLQLAGI